MPFFHANEYKVILYIILSNIKNKIEVVPLLSPSVPRSQPLRRSPSLPDPPLIDWEMYVILKNLYFHAEFMLFFSIFHLQKLAHYCGYLRNNKLKLKYNIELQERPQPGGYSEVWAPKAHENPPAPEEEVKIALTFILIMLKEPLHGFFYINGKLLMSRI